MESTGAHPLSEGRGVSLVVYQTASFPQTSRVGAHASTKLGVFPVRRLPIRRLPIRRLPISRLNKNCPRPYRSYGPKRMNFVFSLGDFV